MRMISFQYGEMTYAEELLLDESRFGCPCHGFTTLL